MRSEDEADQADETVYDSLLGPPSYIADLESQGIIIHARAQQHREEFSASEANPPPVTPGRRHAPAYYALDKRPSDLIHPDADILEAMFAGGLPVEEWLQVESILKAWRMGKKGDDDGAHDLIKVREQLQALELFRERIAKMEHEKEVLEEARPGPRDFPLPGHVTFIDPDDLDPQGKGCG